jgi:hypothetical protein
MEYSAKDIVSLSAGRAFGYIYIITNDINDKVYIGKTTTTIKNRFLRHCKDGRIDKNIHSLDYNIQRIGKEHFKVAEIERCPIE